MNINYFMVFVVDFQGLRGQLNSFPSTMSLVPWLVCSCCLKDEYGTALYSVQALLLLLNMVSNLEVLLGCFAGRIPVPIMTGSFVPRTSSSPSSSVLINVCACKVTTSNSAMLSFPRIKTWVGNNSIDNSPETLPIILLHHLSAQHATF